MGDEGGFNPCECIWGHEMAMRRLLSLLRQSQSVCTDTECFDAITPTAQNQPVDTNFLLMSIFFAFALIMFYLRPRTQSHERDGPTKPANQDNGFNGEPPTPPTSS